MKLKCISNNITSVKPNIRKYAFNQNEQGVVDLTVGSEYIAYGKRQNSYGTFYLILTDTIDVRTPWWMPQEFFKAISKDVPSDWTTVVKGWIKKETTTAPKPYFGAEIDIEDGTPRGIRVFEEMKRRPATAIGDVYEIKVSDEITRYLHLVAFDSIQLNSDVVIVYDTFAKVSSSDFEFYTHTIVSDGVCEGLWKKIASLPALDLNNLVFKDFNDENTIRQEQGVLDKIFGTKPKSEWMIRTPLDSEWNVEDFETGTRIKAEEGSIYPAEDVFYRIKHGKNQI